MAKANSSNNQQAKSSLTKASSVAKPSAKDLRQQVLEDFAVLRLPLHEQSFDEHLARAEQAGLTPLQFLARLVGEQADQRRERAIECGRRSESGPLWRPREDHCGGCQPKYSGNSALFL